jgi:predicted O-methyltransferase YrrM
MIWGGLVYKPEVNDPSTQALRDLAKKVHADERVDVSFLTVGDGTMLAIKR